MVAVLKMIKAVVMVSTLSLISSLILACRNDENVARYNENADPPRPWAVPVIRSPESETAAVVKLAFADHFLAFASSFVKELEGKIDEVKEVNKDAVVKKVLVADATQAGIDLGQFFAHIQPTFTGADFHIQPLPDYTPHSLRAAAVAAAVAPVFLVFVKGEIATLTALEGKTDDSEKAHLVKARQYAEGVVEKLERAVKSPEEFIKNRDEKEAKTEFIERGGTAEEWEAQKKKDRFRNVVRKVIVPTTPLRQIRAAADTKMRSAPDWLLEAIENVDNKYKWPTAHPDPTNLVQWKPTLGDTRERVGEMVQRAIRCGINVPSNHAAFTAGLDLYCDPGMASEDDSENDPEDLSDASE